MLYVYIALACLTGKETEFREDLEKAIRYAKTLECPRLLLIQDQLLLSVLHIMCSI